MKVKSFKEFKTFYLNEGNDIMDPDMIKRIANLTKYNHHTASLILLARTMGDLKSSKILEHISEIQGIVGFLPQQLASYRNEIYKDLISRAKDRYANYSDIINTMLVK